jgi:hypothetical protein
MEQRMDARNLKQRFRNSARQLERGTAVVLAALLALGLWQGYGAWLFGEHVR